MQLGERLRIARRDGSSAHREERRQLLKLNAIGMLDVVPHSYQLEPITKGEAAAAIDEARRRTGE